MNFKKLGLSLATTFVLVGCGAGSSSSTVKIGGNFELTGDVASYGTPMSNAVQLAVEQKGKLLEKTLEYVAYDNKGDKNEVASVAKKLASDKVVGIVGPATTGDAQVSIPISQQAQIPTIFPATTGDGITTNPNSNAAWEFIYRVCFSDNYQGVAGAGFVAKQFPNAKVVILQDTANDYSKGLTDAFVETYTNKYKGQVVAVESYASKDTDFQAVLTSIKAKEFDVLFVPGYYQEVGLIIKQAREMGLNQPIVGGDGLASETLKDLAGAANLTNIFYTSHFSAKSSDADVQAFVKAYEEKYGKQADTFAALAYDAANLLLNAIEKAGSTNPTDITKVINETKDFDGVTGSFSMGADHTPVKSVVVIEFQNGEEVSATEFKAE